MAVVVDSLNNRTKPLRFLTMFDLGTMLLLALIFLRIR